MFCLASLHHYFDSMKSVSMTSEVLLPMERTFTIDILPCLIPIVLRHGHQELELAIEDGPFGLIILCNFVSILGWCCGAVEGCEIVHSYSTWLHLDGRIGCGSCKWLEHSKNHSRCSGRYFGHVDVCSSSHYHGMSPQCKWLIVWFILKTEGSCNFHRKNNYK